VSDHLKLARGIAITLLICGAAELAAFAGLVALDVARGAKLASAVVNRARMHPLAPKIVITLGAFDPIVAQRYDPGTSAGYLRVNDFGFISNGPNASLHGFPRKAAGEIRIVMLGSSSLAGTLLRSDESQTIPAYVERALNSRAPAGRRFSVLNFGSNGGYSFAELRMFFAQVIHLEPDLVIALDGWTDALEAAFNAERSGLRHGLANWSELSYRQNDLFNRIATRRDSVPYVFTYLYLALKQAGLVGREAPDNREAQYESLPWYRISGSLIAERGGLEFILPSNVGAIAAYSAATGPCFIGYLQPIAALARRTNDEEQAALEDYHAKMVAAGNTYFARASFTPAMARVYASYRDAYRKLEVKYAGSRCTRFADLTALFETTPERVYIDGTHYNERGNALVAARVADDIRRLALR
jgi:hypothetical protein